MFYFFLLLFLFYFANSDATTATIIVTIIIVVIIIIIVYIITTFDVAYSITALYIISTIIIRATVSPSFPLADLRKQITVLLLLLLVAGIDGLIRIRIVIVVVPWMCRIYCASSNIMVVAADSRTTERLRLSTC